MKQSIGYVIDPNCSSGALALGVWHMIGQMINRVLIAKQRLNIVNCYVYFNSSIQDAMWVKNCLNFSEELVGFGAI